MKKLKQLLTFSANWRIQLSTCLAGQGGFGLLETMIAVFILLVGITGAMTLVFGGITNLGISKNRLIAANIAQEGLEIIHNIRDNNWLANPVRPWNDWSGDGIADSCFSCSGYVLWDSFSLMGAGGIDLKWNDAAKHYDNSGSAGMSFSRTIIITDLGDLSSPPDGINDYVRVQSVVGWGEAGNCAAGGIDSGKKYCLALEEELYNWRQ